MNKSCLNAVRDTLREYGVPFTITSNGGGKHSTHVSYIAHGVTWRAPVSLSPSDSHAASNARRQIRRVMEGYICLRCQHARITPGRVWCDTCRAKYPGEKVPAFLNEHLDQPVVPRPVQTPQPKPLPVTSAPVVNRVTDPPQRKDTPMATPVFTPNEIAKFTNKSFASIALLIAKGIIPKANVQDVHGEWRPGRAKQRIVGLSQDELTRLVVSNVQPRTPRPGRMPVQVAPATPPPSRNGHAVITPSSIATRLERLGTVSQLDDRRWALVQKIAGLGADDLATLEALLR